MGGGQWSARAVTSRLASGCSQRRAVHPRSRGNAQKEVFLPGDPGMCCSSQFARVLSNSCFLTGNHCSSRCHWPGQLTQVLGGCIFSAHHWSHAQSPPCPSSSPFPQDGFLLCCKSVPCLVFPQKFTPAPASAPVGTPAPIVRQASPPFPAAIAWRKFGVCSSGESSVSKQSAFQNGTKQRQSFPCKLEFNNFKSLNSAQLDKIKMFCPDFNYPLLLNYFIYITVYYVQAFWCSDHFLPFSFWENEVLPKPTSFHKLFCFQQFGVFNRQKGKKSIWKPAALANATGGASFIQNAISTGSFFLVLAVTRLKIQPFFEAVPWGSTLIASPWLQINYKTL